MVCMVYVSVFVNNVLYVQGPHGSCNAKPLQCPCRKAGKACTSRLYNSGNVVLNCPRNSCECCALTLSIHPCLRKIRCHANVSGYRNACCKNREEPDATRNIHGFEKKHVKAAAKLLFKWFIDVELRNKWCRVVR